MIMRNNKYIFKTKCQYSYPVVIKRHAVLLLSVYDSFHLQNV